MYIGDHELVEQTEYPNSRGPGGQAGFPDTKILDIPSELGVGRLVYESPRKGIFLAQGIFELDTEVELELTSRHNNLLQRYGLQLVFLLSGNMGLSWTADSEVSQYSQGQFGFWANSGDYTRRTILQANELVQFVVIQLSPEVLTQYLGDIQSGPWKNLVHQSNSARFLPESSLEKFPAIGLALHQMLNNPYSGISRRCFVESKIMELVVRCNDVLGEPGTQSQPELTTDDYKLALTARNYLIANMTTPPSLKQLANVIGTNQQKLKVTFPKVYGTTVFRYLRTHRLEKARQLLATSGISVSNAALEVGYSHFGHFAAEFRKQFGITPHKIRASSG